MGNSDSKDTMASAASTLKEAAAAKEVVIPVTVEGKGEPEKGSKKPEEEPKKPEEEEAVEVPIKVSDKPAKVLFGAPDGTLYPELPKEDTTKKPEEASKKPDAEAAAPRRRR